MENSAKIRLMLIRRYAVLCNESMEKNIRKFAGSTIDELIEKQYNRMIFSVVLIVLSVLALLVQLAVLYMTGIVNFGLAANILLVVIFQGGLLKELEKKEILKILKAME